MVMLHIKLKGMEHRAQCKQIFGSYLTHTLNLWAELKVQKKSECGHVAERNIDYHRNKLFDLTHTPDFWVWFKSDIEIVQISLCGIELSTKTGL